MKTNNSDGRVVWSVRLLSCILGFDSESGQTNDFKIGIHSEADRLVVVICFRQNHSQSRVQPADASSTKIHSTRPFSTNIYSD